MDVQVTADYKSKSASVLQLGPNPSEVENKLLIPEEEIKVKNGSSINLIVEDLKYTLEFLDLEPRHHTKHKHHSPNVTPKKLKTVTSPSRTDNDSMDTENCSSSLFPTDVDSVLPTNDIEHSENTEMKPDSIQQTVMNAFSSLSTEDRWEEYDHSKILIFTPVGLIPREKVAAFDMDHTIIGTKSGKVFPVSTDDWRILYAEIPGKLKKLHSEGYKLMLFTNQKGISRGRTSAPDFKKKVERIIQKLGIPIQAMVSTGSGKYRKPNTGMWEYFVQKCNQGVAVDIDSCIYVGDAAGRPENWAPKKKKDFSCADRLFALNVGLKFFTPEEFFLGQKSANYKMPAFDPRHIKTSPLAVKFQPPPAEELNSDSVASSSSEVIVFVGFPAAGKSHFASTYLIPKGYIHINRDNLGSWQKCVAECSKALSKKDRVVIDNTNPDVESRSRYIELSKKCGVPCRCFYFVCSLEQAKHNNMYRELLGPDEKHKGVTDMVLNAYKSKFKEPSLSEGFSTIVKVNFIPKFKNKHEEKLFKRFLIEK
ncbi:hypothetical protein JTE90_001798 [Oedothorax gibbosus]|uniref:Bifunctional polynucleotide phosphatase/kinase n=1 Tax=Oedothorax gibbosus TaxID=931172 RepID=A0AAV6VTH2_9ARAC|nr:hypothetical protein JTE90_001798 [Oedothorax gibbosus]